MIQKEITYFGQRCILACDAHCNRAWGVNQRPKIELSDDPDDVVYLGDDELGDAPEDPGTYEGGEAKPRLEDERLNKWCARECERSEIKPVGEAFELPDWSTRVKNKPD